MDKHGVRVDFIKRTSRITHQELKFYILDGTIDIFTLNTTFIMVEDDLSERVYRSLAELKHGEYTSDNRKYFNKKLLDSVHYLFSFEDWKVDNIKNQFILIQSPRNTRYHVDIYKDQDTFDAMNKKYTTILANHKKTIGTHMHNARYLATDITRIACDTENIFTIYRYFGSTDPCDIKEFKTFSDFAEYLISL